MMVAGSKQQQLTFEKGLANVPSDAVCDDNMLQAAEGMIYREGEHKVIQSPKLSETVNGRLLFVHQFNDIKVDIRYVVNEYSGFIYPMGFVLDKHLVYDITTNNYTAVYGRTVFPISDLRRCYFISHNDLQDGDVIYVPNHRVTLYDYFNVYPDAEHGFIVLPSREPIRNNMSEYVYHASDFPYYDTGFRGVALFVSDEGYEDYDGDVIVERRAVKSPDIKIAAIGSVVTISDGTQLKYFKYSNGSYSEYASQTPTLNINYVVPCGGAGSISLDSATNDINDFMVHVEEANTCLSTYGYNVNVTNQETYNDLAIGMYRKALNKAAEKKRFARPFMLRAAALLPDGSYTAITQPVMVFPYIYNVGMVVGDNNRLFLLADTFDVDCSVSFDGLPEGSKIVMFASEGVDLYDTLHEDSIRSSFTTNEVVAGGYYDNSNAGVPSDVILRTFRLSDKRAFEPLQLIDEKTVMRQLVEKSVFYRIGEVSKNSPVSFSLSSITDDVILRNLTSQEQLPYDDYHSRSKLNPSYINAYNGRLNIANVKRGFFEGFGHFYQRPYLVNDTPTEATYDFYVWIKTSLGNEIVVKHTKTSYYNQGQYFYYPDARAKKVLITRGGTTILYSGLTPHDLLNGAFCFFGPRDTLPTQGAAIPTPAINAEEDLGNVIITSEVDSPNTFLAKGYFTVGTGNITGVAPITQALSQGQFGHFPLMVFSESGIWAATLNQEGYFTNIHSISREVCNQPKTITQTDNAVYFMSEKGLMKITGSDVVCVSQQLNGKTDTPLQVDLMAYDYRDSLLWLFGSTSTFVYSIQTGTFSTVLFHADGVVNSYPDTLLQQGANIYTLLGRDNINDDSTDYAATLVTRPMKLENALALKTILQVKHILSVNSDASLVFGIEASNNLKDWCTITSLHGVPWKYYRFRYTFTGLKATDAFAGTMLVTEERRTDKLR